MRSGAEDVSSQEVREPVKYSRVPFPQFTDRKITSETSDIRQLQRVKAEITVELAQTRMALAEMLRLTPLPDGVDLNDPNITEAERRQYIVKLDRQIGESVDLFINGRIFAKGEVISTGQGGRYAVRIISILTDTERIEQQSMRQSR
jgi:flagellar motor switch/type III secretory pathway protein FliN